MEKLQGVTKITKEFVVEYAHRLMHHKGGCRFIHGHSGRVIVSIKGMIHSHSGMVIDFSALKEACSTIVGKYDHALVLNNQDPLLDTLNAPGTIELQLIAVPGEPTAENFSRWIAEELTTAGYDVAEITFFETEKNSATFTVGA